MPTHLIFMENNYLFYAQQPQLWTVSCLKARVSLSYSVLESLLHYSIVLFYYAVSWMCTLEFRGKWNFPCFFFWKFLACASLNNCRNKMKTFLRSLKYDAKYCASSIFKTKWLKSVIGMFLELNFLQIFLAFR